MSDVPPVWKENRLVESFDVDVHGRLRAHVLFGFLLNAAWKHTSFTDHGYHDLSARNQMWVLSKFQLVIRRRARWGDQILIETWGKGTEKLYGLRDFTVSSAGGDRLASATSAWLILDQATRRPLRVDQVIFPRNPGRQELETDVRRLAPLSAPTEAGRFRAAYSDIDPNGHVTAMRYLAWMTDSHTREFLETMSPASMEISFLGEGALDDEVVVRMEKRDGRELCSVTRETDQKDLCRAEIRWALPEDPSG